MTSLRKDKMTRKELEQILTDLGIEPSKATVTALLSSFNEEKRNAIAETTNKIMDDVKDWVKPEDYQKLKEEYEALKKNQPDDYEDLKKFKADTLAEKENNQKKSYLESLGFKRPDLFFDKVDWSKAKYDEGKKTYTGIDVDSLKKTYSDLYSEPRNQGKITFGGVGSGNQEKPNTNTAMNNFIRGIN